MLDVVNVFNKAIPCRFDFVELSGNHVEPCVGFDDFFEAQGGHAAHVALGVDVGEVVCHGVTLVELAFSVYFFFTFFSDLDHHASVVSEGRAAIAAFCKRGEVKDFCRLGCHVRHCFAFGLARSHTDFAIRQSVRHRDQNHALELADLQDRHFVFHVHTMHEILQVVNFYLLFLSLFFDGLDAVGWHALCSQHLPCQPPRFFKKKVLDFCVI